MIHNVIVELLIGALLNCVQEEFMNCSGGLQHNISSGGEYTPAYQNCAS